MPVPTMAVVAVRSSFGAAVGALGRHLLVAHAPHRIRKQTWEVREFAGHSKWHNIQHTKGKNDRQRAAAFQKA